MARFTITIRAASPLSLGTTKAYGGTLIETGQYVSGGHLRGALGMLKRYASSTEQAELDTLFGTDEHTGIRFPHCYLSSDQPAFPTPFSALTCKRNGGLYAERGTRNKYHGVADTLLRQLAYDRVARDGDRWRIPLAFQYRCQQCGDRTEAYTKLMEYRGPHTYKAVTPVSHRQTRVAINRARLTAEEGMLYSVQALDEGSLLIGILEVDEPRAKPTCKWLERITRLGGRTSRGFGRVQVTTETYTPFDSVRDRIDDFNERYHQFEVDLCTIADDPPEPDRRMLFTVNLRSDALLRNAMGLPTLRLDESMLRAALAETLADDEQQVLGSIPLERMAQFTQPQHVSGWHTAWQLPKEVWLASQMGGLYVFAATVDDADGRRAALIDWLSRLESIGVGEMRADGYGQLAICDPFHLEVDPV